MARARVQTHCNPTIRVRFARFPWHISPFSTQQTRTFEPSHQHAQFDRCLAQWRRALEIPFVSRVRAKNHLHTRPASMAHDYRSVGRCFSLLVIFVCFRLNGLYGVRRCICCCWLLSLVRLRFVRQGSLSQTSYREQRRTNDIRYYQTPALELLLLCVFGCLCALLFMYTHQPEPERVQRASSRASVCGLASALHMAFQHPSTQKAPEPSVSLGSG